MSSSSSSSSSSSRVALLGTAAAQEAIRHHQHPPKEACRPPLRAGARAGAGDGGTRFLISSIGPQMNGYGIGSLLHILSSHLALAMKLGRILLLDPNDGNVYSVDTTHTTTTAAAAASSLVEGNEAPFTCGNVKSFECFFRPLSTCDVADLNDWRAHDTERGNGGKPIEFYVPSREEELSGERVLLAMGEIYKEPPPQLQVF